jgi:hypothetical protein
VMGIIGSWDRFGWPSGQNFLSGQLVVRHC